MELHQGLSFFLLLQGVQRTSSTSSSPPCLQMDLCWNQAWSWSLSARSYGGSPGTQSPRQGQLVDAKVEQTREYYAAISQLQTSFIRCIYSWIQWILVTGSESPTPWRTPCATPFHCGAHHVLQRTTWRLTKPTQPGCIHGLKHTLAELNLHLDSRWLGTQSQLPLCNNLANNLEVFMSA